MTPIQTLEIRAGEIRKRLAEIGGMEELTTKRGASWTRSRWSTLTTTPRGRP